MVSAPPSLGGNTPDRMRSDEALVEDRHQSLVDTVMTTRTSTEAASTLATEVPGPSLVIHVQTETQVSYEPVIPGVDPNYGVTTTITSQGRQGENSDSSYAQNDAALQATMDRLTGADNGEGPSSSQGAVEHGGPIVTTPTTLSHRHTTIVGPSIDSTPSNRHSLLVSPFAAFEPPEQRAWSPELRGSTQDEPNDADDETDDRRASKAKRASLYLRRAFQMQQGEQGESSTSAAPATETGGAGERAGGTDDPDEITPAPPEKPQDTVSNKSTQTGEVRRPPTPATGTEAGGSTTVVWDNNAPRPSRWERFRQRARRVGQILRYPRSYNNPVNQAPQDLNIGESALAPNTPKKGILRKNRKD